ncbi:MAG: hypothetical protein L0Z54_03885 [Thermoplasmata archaeon]|nr:hypothetical protein [Thermoplasmata archaeon]
MKVITVSSEGSYAVGDTVDLEVHVFERGARAEADNLTVWVGPYWSGRQVNATPTGTPGIYHVQFTVTENDTDYWGDSVDVQILAEKGNVTGVEYVSLPLEEEGVVDLEITHTGPLFLRPGNTFSCEFETTKDGEPTDPDATECLVNGPGLSETVNATRKAAGRYAASFDIPDDIGAGEFWFYAEADFNGSVAGEGAGFYVVRLQAWAMLVSSDAAQVVVDVLVNGIDGNVTPGAGVRVAYDHDGDYYTEDIVRSGTTDANGSARLTLPHEDLAALDGTLNVTAGEVEQGDFFSIPIREEAPDEAEVPTPGRFDVTTAEEGYVAGSASYSFMAFNDSVAWADSEVIYYFVLQGSPARMIVGFGKVGTDALGAFTVQLNVPAGVGESLRCIFQAAVGPAIEEPSNDGMRYEEDNEYLGMHMRPERSGDVRISTDGAIRLGEDNGIAVTVPGTSGYMFIGIVPPGTTLSDLDQLVDWLWLLVAPDIVPLVPGTQTIALMLPAFLPEDAEVLVMVLSFSEGAILYNYMTVRPGQAGSSGDGGDDGWLPGFETATMMAALVLAIAATRVRREGWHVAQATPRAVHRRGRHLGFPRPK